MSNENNNHQHIAINTHTHTHACENTLYFIYLMNGLQNTRRPHTCTPLNVSTLVLCVHRLVDRVCWCVWVCALHGDLHRMHRECGWLCMCLERLVLHLAVAVCALHICACVPVCVLPCNALSTRRTLSLSLSVAPTSRRASALYSHARDVGSDSWKTTSADLCFSHESRVGVMFVCVCLANSRKYTRAMGCTFTRTMYFGAFVFKTQVLASVRHSPACVDELIVFILIPCSSLKWLPVHFSHLSLLLHHKITRDDYFSFEFFARRKQARLDVLVCMQF